MQLIQSPMHNHHQQQNRSTSVTPRRRSRMASPPAFSAARLFAKLSGHQQQSIEQKMAELRAVYSTQPPPPPPPSITAATECSNGSCNTSAKGPFSTLAAAPRRPGRTSLPTPSLGDMLEPLQFGSRSCASSRRASTATTCFPAPSIMELASSAGLMSLSPSDLVFESSVLGIAYYDFVLSVCEVSPCEDTVSVAAGAVARKNKAACVATSTLEPPASACPRGSLTPAAKRRVHGTGSDPTQPSPAAVVVAAQQQRKTGAVGGVLAKLAESGKKRPQTAVSSSSTTGGAPGDRISLADNIAQLAEECETKIGLDSTDQSITAYRLLLAKLDRKTNVEWFESVIVPAELLERNGIPVSELSLLTMGILVWRCTLNNARLLCLVNGVQQQLHEDSSTITASFEALKRAACKYKCMHHVITVGQRRPSAASTHSSGSSRRSSMSSGSYGQNYQQDSGMKLRVLMCQSRSELQELPAHALRDAKFLLASSTNPLLCLCFPLT